MQKPIPYISYDNFSQEGIFDYWNGKLPGHAHVKRTYPDVVRMCRQFHGCPGSGGGIERVFTAAGKQHDALKKSTMDKTLESTLKAGMNTKLPTCDDKRPQATVEFCCNYTSDKCKRNPYCGCANSVNRRNGLPSSTPGNDKGS